MGNLNSCFDYDAVSSSVQNLSTAIDNNATSLSQLEGNIASAVESFRTYDKTHDVLEEYIESLSEARDSIIQGRQALEEFRANVFSCVSLFQDAEGDIENKLSEFANGIKNNFGNATVAGYISRGLVTADTLATTREEFIGGATDEVKDFLTDYAMYNDDYYPSEYNSVEEWKMNLIKQYTDQGYSSYDAEDLACAEMAKYRLSKTEADVTENAISEFASTQYSELQTQVDSEYQELLDKYQELGMDENQAKELATAESEYRDAENEFQEIQGDNVKAWVWEHSTAKKRYDEWQALKEEYGIADAESTTTESNTETTSPTSTSESSTSSATTSSSGYSSSTNSSGVQYRTQSYSASSNSGASTGSVIGSSSNSGGTSSSAPSNNTSTPTPSEPPSTSGETSTPSETPSTPETSTPSGENNGTSGPIIEEEVPTEETPNPGETTNTENNTGTTTPSTNTGESNTNASPSTPPSSGNNNTGYVPFGNNNNNGNVSNSGGSFEDPGTSTTPNENVSTTTPSAPDSDAGIKDNSGETLDVISIDKEPGDTPSPTPNDGGSVIPAILGVGVAGAAIAGGAKILHDKKNKDKMYSYDDEETEDNNKFSYSNSYEYNSSEVGAQEAPAEKYKAGSANKLVLEDAPENINIDNSIADIPNGKEELE